MKSKNLLSGLGLFLLMFSCDLGCFESHTSYLDHSQWFHYGPNDMLVFSCNTADNDTFIVKNITNAFEWVDDNKYEFFWVEYIEIEGCENCPVEGFSRSSRGPVESVSVFGQFSNVSFYFDETSPWPYVLGDTVIRNVYIEKEIPVMDSINDKVKAIFYSHDFGIIRYDMNDGRVYRLQIK